MAARPTPRRRSVDPKHVGVVERTHGLVDALYGRDVHAQRLASLKDGVVGVVESASLCIHAIGRGLAAVHNLCDKHAVKQIDRLIGNEQIDVDALSATWARSVLGAPRDVRVNLDWTDFDSSGHSMLVLSLQTPHSRAMPLMWKTVEKATLKDRRNDHEDDLLVRFQKVVPEGMKVTVVADRGFSDQKLYRFISEELGFDYIIRFRGVVHVTTAEGNHEPARDLVRAGGRMRVLRDTFVTAARTPVPVVAIVHDKGMKDAWFLASSRSDLTGAELKRIYGRRFSCEETFRDIKDMRYGMGMDWKEVRRTDRRDRLMLLAVLALHLLTLLGAAGERAGLDRLLKTNTSTSRQLSLVRQGRRWYELIPGLREDRLQQLVAAYQEIIASDLTAIALCG
jgi:hypothetical protein